MAKLLDPLRFSPEKQPHSITGLLDAYLAFLGETSEPEGEGSEAEAEREHYRGIDYVLGQFVTYCNKQILQVPLVQRGAPLQEYRRFLSNLLDAWKGIRHQDDYNLGRVEALTLVIEHIQPERLTDYH